ncbi:immunoglobulin-like domain-containing protein [Paenibacillus sp. YYML68]|uniref:immunoglobulin-like domain-containing protein n=1 Tax=Paenibacillus sp. YYML68 TaxID=2909250 RepID=UPI0024918B2E|nr:immunoglobulin-like domain-containing protein [Paenibacillus sp. YYML68]
MPKKKNDKPLVKGIATVLSATMAATSVLSVLPASVANADEAAAVAAANSAASVAEMQAALTRVDMALNLTGYNSLSSTGKDIVAQNLLNYRNSNGNYASSSVIQTQLNTEVTARQNVENMENALANVNNAASAADMNTALRSTHLGLILASYNALTSDASRLAVSQKMIDNRGGGYADKNAIQTMLNNQVSLQMDADAAAAALANVNAAGTNSDMHDALSAPELGLVLNGYNALVDDAMRLRAAGRVLTARGAGYANKSVIQTALNNAVQAEWDALYVDNVNNAASDADAQTALEDPMLGLILTSYNSLSADGKLWVAGQVRAYRIANGAYAGKSAIQTRFNTYVTDRSNYEAFKPYVDVVNSAANATAMRSALEQSGLALNLIDYYRLTTAYKNAVATTVLGYRNSNGDFVYQADVQTQLDAAVAVETVRQAVEVLNTASDVNTTKSAIEATGLGLDLTGNGYNSISAADRLAVATLVMNRKGGGYADQYAIQAAVNTAVIDVVVAIAAVNAASDAGSMQTALEQVNLTLELTANGYQALSASDKLDIGLRVLTGRGASYADQGAIQTAVTNAVAALNAGKAAVDVAADAAAMRTALVSSDLLLDVMVYSALSDADQSAVAGMVLAGRGAGYADKAAIQAALDSAIAINAPVAAVNQAAEVAGMKTALTDVALGLTLTTYNSFTIASQNAVAAAVLAARPVGGYVDQAAIQASLDTAIVTYTPLEAVNDAGNVTAMQTALTDVTLGLTLGDYTALTNASKDNVAQAVLDARPADGYASATDVQGSLDSAIVTNAPLEAVNDAADIASMKLAITDIQLGLNLTAYADLSVANQNAVAHAVLSARPADGYTLTSIVQTELNNAITAVAAVEAVNDALNVTGMQAALTDVALSLDLTAYNALTVASQAAVASDILITRPADGYADATAVQAALDAAITANVPVEAVNDAADLAAIQAALTDHAIGLDLTAYNALTNASKDIVAQAVLNARPVDGYADAEAIQTSLDAEVAANIPLEAVNDASDVTTMKAAVADVALGLNLSAYNDLSVANQNYVANAILSARPIDGYSLVSAIQSELDGAVTDVMAVEAVNDALDVSGMQAALIDVALALNLTAYNALTVASQAAVADHVLANRPSDGYALQADVQAALDAAVAVNAPLEAVNDAADLAAIQVALTDNALGLNLTTYTALTNASKDVVAQAVLNARPADGYADVTSLQTVLDAEVALNAPLEAVNDASDITEMKAAVSDLALGLNLTAYNDLSVANQNAVASAILSARPADGYSLVSTVQTELNTAVTAVAAVEAVNDATDVATTQSALTNVALGLTLTAYNGLTVASQNAVAADVLANRPADGYADQTAVQTALDAAIALNGPIEAVNDAVDVMTMQTALTDMTLGLDLTAYTALTNASKDVVAQAVLSARPADGYVDLVAIQAALDSAVAANVPLEAVNDASDVTEMKAAVSDVALGLDLTAYNDLSVANQNAVATSILSARPADGYSLASTVQTELNTAVTAVAAVEAVNDATDVATTQSALTNVALGLTLTAYNGLTVASQNAVAADVLASRPADGYADQTAVQTALDAAVATNAPVEAVNDAVDVMTMQTALTDMTLGLDLTAYTALTNASKDVVAQAVLSARPADGYVDLAAIQAALDSAVVANAPLEAVNDASDVTEMKAAVSDVALGLDLTAYNDLSVANQNAVASAILSARPADGYSLASTVQTELNTAVTAVAAVEAVNDATDVATTQAALTNMALGLTLTAYNDLTVASQNAVAADVLASRPADGYADQTAVQTALDAAVATNAPVEAVNDAVDVMTMQTALTDMTLGLDLTAYTALTNASKDVVAQSVLSARPADGYVDIAAIQAALDSAVVANAPLEAVNDASDVTEMKAAVSDLALGLNLTDYNDLSTANKNAAASAILSARPADGYSLASTVQTELNTAVTAVAAVEAVNDATDVATTQSALTNMALGLTLTAYNDLTVASQNAVAADVLASRPADGYADQAAVQTALDAAVATNAPVEAVNDAVDVMTMQTALTDITLGLDLTAYTALTNASKDVVAQAVLSARPADGYVDFAAIQAALDSAVAANVPLEAVNDASDVTEMKAAVSDVALSLDLTAYNTLSTASQNAVADAILSARPVDGYSLTSTVQTELNTAVTAVGSVEAVNDAADTTDMQMALTNVVLGLDLVAYDALTTASKIIVAQDVLDHRPTDGYVDQSAVQTALNLAITANIPVEAVNDAVDIPSMQAALTDVALGLDLSSYQTLTVASQNNVAQTMLTYRPFNGYAGQEVIQNLLGNAILVNMFVEYVNDAMDASSMHSALTDPDLALDLTVYNSLSLANRNVVLQEMLTNRPVIGYASASNIQIELDAQVAAVAAVEAVNDAVDVTSMQAALTNVALGLDLTYYNAMSTDNQDAVAQSVISSRPSEGYSSQAAILTIFDDIVAVEGDKYTVELGLHAMETIAAVTSDLTLPVSANLGSTVTWSSDKPDYIAANGIVTRPAYIDGDQAVTLTATIQKGSFSKTKIFVVKVLKQPVTDIEAVAVAKSALVITYEPGESSTGVTTVLGLPDTGVDGTAISWSSDQPLVIDSFGHVTRPLYSAGDATVVLTATITKGVEVDTKVFVVKVLKQTQTDAEAVAAAAQALMIGYATDEGMNGVTQPLTLANTGIDGTTISWSSDSTAVNANTGGVVRPAYSEGDVSVALTATITKGTEISTKSFLIKVLKETQTHAEAVAAAKKALEVEYALSDSIDHVTQSLTLPSTGVDGTSISWSSSDDEVVKSNGTVIRPAFSTGDASVTLTATITKGAETATKTFLVKVLKVAQNDVEAVAAAKQALEIGYAVGDSINGVTQALTLPAAGVDGTSIEWSTDSMLIEAATGIVTRPMYSYGDVSVTLTATIKKGTETATKTFLVKVLKEAQNDVEAVAAAKQALEIGYAMGDSINGVTQALTLPAAGADGTTITWSSDKPAVDVSTGAVTRPAYAAGDMSVTLTATITKGTETATKTFLINVLKKTQSDVEAVAAAKQALEIGYAMGDSINGVTQSLTLPAAGADGTAITWSSDKPAVDVSTGAVTRPAYAAGDMSVTLTATITKGTETATKTFLINVLKKTQSDVEAVAAAKQALDVIYTGSDSMASVTQSLTLVTTGADGTTISWSTSDTTVNAATGAVQRPAFSQGDKAVTLTATITKGTETTTKVFLVNVVKQVQTDSEAVAAASAALTVGYTGSDTASSVTQSLTLPTTGAAGTTVTWSSDQSIVTANGTVVRPSLSQGDTIVTLTAVIQKGSASVTKSFVVKVLKQNVTAAPLASDITVTNNAAGQADTVTVKNVQAGHMVKVYDAAGTTLHGSVIVPVGSTTASVQVTQLGVQNGSISVSVQAPGKDESAKTAAVFAAENAKPYVVAAQLTNDNGITAKATITPTAGIVVGGEKYVVFQLMNGTTAESISVVQFNSNEAAQLSAIFNRTLTAQHTVKVFLIDKFDTSITDLGTSLAEAVTVSKQ